MSVGATPCGPMESLYEACSSGIPHLWALAFMKFNPLAGEVGWGRRSKKCQRMGQPSPLSRCVVNLHRLSSVGDPNMSHEVRPSFLLVYYLILEMYLVNLIYFSQIKKHFPH